MLKPVTVYYLFYGVLLTVMFLGVMFVINYQFHLKTPSHSAVNLPETVIKSTDDITPSDDKLTEPDWQNLDELLGIVGKDSQKRDQVIESSTNRRNPAALYLRGFSLMVNNKPLQALTVFNQLNTKDIPAKFLYPVYRLYSQMQPGSVSVNRYLNALNGAISSGSLSPLIAARVQAKDGDLYSALSNYLKTDPAQWVTYDVECIRRIGQHSGLSSEVLRMISGAVKSQRLSEEVEESLRLLSTSEKDLEEVIEFKRILEKELVQDSSSGKLAVSSIKQMLDNRTLFLQHDYQKILSQHQDTNPLMAPNESILILFLSSVQLKNRLEMDRWGQEIKRRFPNREVAAWVSELTTSVK